jgi:hypothetical protein
VKLATLLFICQMWRCVKFCKLSDFHMLKWILFVLALLSRLPQLERCQIFEPTLVDPLLKGTYKGLPRLPKYSAHYVDFLCDSYHFLLGWQNTPQLGALLASMVDLIFLRSKTYTTPPMRSESVIFVILLLMRLFGVQIHKEAPYF